MNQEPQIAYDPEFEWLDGVRLHPTDKAIVCWRDPRYGGVRMNADHSPGPVALGMPEPHTTLEKLLAYIEVGWYPGDQFFHNCLHGEVLIPAEDGRRLSLVNEDDPRYLDVYTSPEHLPLSTYEWVRVGLNTLVRKVFLDRECTAQGIAENLRINPGGPYGRLVNVRDLAEGAAQHLRMHDCGEHGVFEREGTPPPPALSPLPSFELELPVPARPAPVVVEPDESAELMLTAADWRVLNRLHRLRNVGSGAPLPVAVQRFEVFIGVDEHGRRFVTRDPLMQFEPVAPKVELTLADRLRGSLIAGAIGDALGAPTENLPMEVVYERCGPLGVVDLEGDALVTDDTQMTMFTLEGVIRAHHRMRHTGSADLVPVLQHAYQRWLHTQKNQWDKARGPWSTLESPDGWLITNQDLFRTQAPGLTCVSALQSFGASGQFGTFARPVNNSKGCGGLMRTAPLALWSDDVKVVFEVAAMSAALTHGHPTGFLAAGTFAVLVHQLLRGSALRSAIDIAIAQLVGWPGHEETLVAVRHALELAELGSPSPARVEQLGAGAVSESALAIALYAALVTDDPNDALLVAVNHGGDSDSTASVCGNLVGAVYGTDVLRQDWVERVQFHDVLDRLVTDALAEFGTTPPDWGTRYPPS